MSASVLPGITYILRSSIYVSLTNRCNACSLIESRGPGFAMPASCGFEPLPPSLEPTPEQVADAVRLAMGDERLAGGAANEVCFAGMGEPLLKRRQLEEAARLIGGEHDTSLRLVTNGLVPSSEVADVASGLHAAGFRSARVALATADPEQYDSLMRPDGIRLTPAFSLPLGHEEVCGFVSACISAGMTVECNAVAAPGVDVDSVSALAASLGATFRSRSWHP